MILSDLLGCRVLEPDGTVIGRVVDARFRRGPARRSHEGELELIALIVSPHSRLSFYGYERGRVNRPAIIDAVVSRLHKGSRIIPWECVARVTGEEVRLGVKAPVIPLDARVPIAEG